MLRLQLQAEAEVASAEQEHRDLLDCWREMPSVPSKEDYTQACVERPFGGPVPPVPDEPQMRQQLKSEIDARVRKERRGGGCMLLFFGLVMFPCIFGGVGASLQQSIGNWSVLAGLVAYAGFVALLAIPWRRGGPKLALKKFEEEWPERWRSVQAAYEEYTQWPERERERVDWLKKLVAGDLEELEETVTSSLEDLDFPFETQCRVAIPESERAFVLLDLPELEDVIPEVKQRALKNGTIKEVRRTKADRNEDYLQLSAGIALLLARTALAAGPTLRFVHLAAYTQRRQRGTGMIADEYVYEAVFDRESVARWDPASVEPVRILAAPSNRLDLRDNGKLKRIEAPKWMEGVLDSP
jgi:hypothetical protein